MDKQTDLIAESVGLKTRQTKNPYDSQVGGNHYKKKHDIAQFCIENGVGAGEFSVMKYVFRHEEKNGFEDLEKAHHWLQFLAYSKYGKSL